MSVGMGRMGLVMVACCLGVSGVVVATDAVEFPAVTTVELEQAASSTCAAAGPYVVPELGSVGLPPALRLCPSGSIVVSEPGTVLDGMDLRGGIVVDAPGVVVRRSRITGDGSSAYGVLTTATGSVRVEDSTLTGRFTEAAIGGAGWTAERVEIVGISGDGAHAGAGSRLRASTLSRFEPGPDVDGVEVFGPDVVIEGTTVRMGERHRSAVGVEGRPGAAGPGGRDGPVVLRMNVLGGGEYTVRQAGGVADDVEVVGNRFARDFGQAPMRLSPTAVTAENTYLDGAPVPGA
jgi:hypothetical protein